MTCPGERSHSADLTIIALDNSLKDRYRSVFRLCGCLLFFDLVLVIIHCMHRLGFGFESVFFSIETDHGLAEIFQYGQELAIILLLILSASRLGLKGLYAWAALFLFVVVDDAFSLHEQVGVYLADIADFAPEYLRPQDLGELLFLAAAGGLLFSFIGLCFLRGPQRFRSITFDIVFLFAGLVFFGIFVDAIHGVFYKIAELGLIEDGGELVVISLILSYSWALYSLPEEKQIRLVESLWSYLRSLIS